MVPLHPQACPGHPDRVRWVVPPGVLPFTGAAAAVPEPLARLLDDGTLATVRLDEGAVVTGLRPGRSWTADGARVRTAVHAALDRPTAWRPADGTGPDGTGPDGTGPDGTGPDGTGPDGTDARLAAVARELVEGEAGRFARSHGGSIELLDVRDGVVTVRLGGACDGCPAARVTLHLRLDAELRRRCPQLREVRAVDPPSHVTRLARLLPLPLARAAR